MTEKTDPDQMHRRDEGKLSEDQLVIAHLSDLHVGSDSDEAWISIKRLLSEERPHLLIVTGDLAENPWPRLHKTVKEKLIDLCDACGMPKNALERRLLIIPGNHDCGIKGNIGLWPVTWWPMKSHFSVWLKKPYALFEKDKIVFFLFDSNPTLYRFATGYVSSTALDTFDSEWTNMQKQVHGFDEFIKIALVHHHPLPIPYSEHFESYLVLRNAGEFVRRLTQKKIDLILHGHKHNQVVSNLELGTVMSGDIPLTVIASGATTKRQEAPNGCNLIYINRNRTIEVVQAYKRPGQDFVKEKPRILPTPGVCVSRSYEKLKKQLGFEHGFVDMEMYIDEEGDAHSKSNMSLEITDSNVFRGFDGPVVSVDRGSIENFAFKLQKGSVSYQIKKDGKPMVREVRVEFPREVEAWRGEKAIEYEYSHWAFNSSARHAIEYTWMYPNRPAEQPQEFTDIMCYKPFRVIRLKVDFHKDCKVDSPELRILRESSTGEELREEWLENLYNWNLDFWKDEQRDEQRIVVNLNRPMPGYHYRIVWNLLEPDKTPIETKAKGEIERIMQVMRKGLRHSEMEYDPIIGERLQRMTQDVDGDVRGNFNIGLTESIEVSLMTYLVEEGKIPEIAVIAANVPDESPIRNYRITFGDGTAGRAWKLNKLQRYLKREERADDEKGTPYVPIFEGYHHEVLYSVPLRHPGEQRLVFGVLNVGSVEAGSALIPNSWEEVDFVVRIGSIAVDVIVPAIFEMCGIGS